MSRNLFKRADFKKPVFLMRTSGNTRTAVNKFNVLNDPKLNSLVKNLLSLEKNDNIDFRSKCIIHTV